MKLNYRTSSIFLLPLICLFFSCDNTPPENKTQAEMIEEVIEEDVVTEEEIKEEVTPRAPKIEPIKEKKRETIYLNVYDDDTKLYDSLIYRNEGFELEQYPIDTVLLTSNTSKITYLMDSAIFEDSEQSIVLKLKDGSSHTIRKEYKEEKIYLGIHPNLNCHVVKDADDWYFLINRETASELIIEDINDNLFLNPDSSTALTILHNNGLTENGDYYRIYDVDSSFNFEPLLQVNFDTFKGPSNAVWTNDSTFQIVYNKDSKTGFALTRYEYDNDFDEVVLKGLSDLKKGLDPKKESIYCSPKPTYGEDHEPKIHDDLLSGFTQEFDKWERWNLTEKGNILSFRSNENGLIMAVQRKVEEENSYMLDFINYEGEVLFQYPNEFSWTEVFHDADNFYIKEAKDQFVKIDQNFEKEIIQGLPYDSQKTIISIEVVYDQIHLYSPDGALKVEYPSLNGQELIVEDIHNESTYKILSNEKARIWNLGYLCWDDKGEKLYVDNTGESAMACIWEIDLKAKTIAKIIPEHEAEHPTFFRYKGVPHLIYFEEDNIKLATPKL
ncbi:hypothetical protein [Flammeovirga sp. SJP92]|uniref:hypothetical protein n=1 Tax=Flammeovirga sp. SJP92 TaxID=1775430 RepID=UPI000786ECCD|nr:hypothetical protein [Flammeovirga sp. SJP92]KXX69504.1 hypothetical protein AVL50_15640 [Flammeovirga sp. SJP92]